MDTQCLGSGRILEGYCNCIMSGSSKYGQTPNSPTFPGRFIKRFYETPQPSPPDFLKSYEQRLSLALEAGFSFLGKGFDSFIIILGTEEP